jgi:hypothetical protein
MSSNLKLPVSLDDVPLSEELPPIVLTAFTRPELLKEVLSAIAQQSLLPQQILAFIDGSRTVDDEPLIGHCVSLLREFSETIPVNIVTRTRNLGCDENTVSALTEVFSSYSALVFLEDDNVPNPCFYERMCRLLEAYRSHQQVFSVSAYANFPEGFERLIDTDFMVSNRVFSWGFGTWADRWNAIDIANRPQGYNPFGNFYNIPATVQTKYTIVNQFFLEKNKQADWVISLTLAALYNDYVHVTPMVSFVRNIGFGHPQAKTYRGPEPSWVNASYDSSVCPNSLPSSLELLDALKTPLDGKELTYHLAKKGLWLSPSAMWHLLWRYHRLRNVSSLLKLFLAHVPLMLRRWRSGLPV